MSTPATSVSVRWRPGVKLTLLVQIIRRAVSGMLPKNKIRRRRLERLHIFPDADHPFGANILKDYTQPPAPAPTLSSSVAESLEAGPREAGLPRRKGEILAAVREAERLRRASEGL